MGNVRSVQQVTTPLSKRLLLKPNVMPVFKRQYVLEVVTFIKGWVFWQ